MLRKIHYILLISVVVTMPFSLGIVKLNSLLIILFSLTSLLLFFLSKPKNRIGYTFHLILFIALYILYILGLFETNNFHEAFTELQRKLPLLLFPLIFFVAPQFSAKEVKTVLLSFALACIIVALYCLTIAFYHFIKYNDTVLFFYHSYSGIVGMHAIYLSMYFCFAIAILLFLYSKEISHFKLRNKILFYFAVFMLGISILLLSGRIQFLLLIIGVIIYVTYLLGKDQNILKSVLKAFFVGVCILGLIFLFPINRERIKEAINYKGAYAVDKKWGGRALRQLNWTCAVKLIKEKPIKGTGTGDVQDELDKCYIKSEYIPLTYWKNVRFNAHNQYLEIFLELGIVGLLVFLLNLVIPFIHVLKKGKLLYWVFILVFAISCLTESMLERQSGIVFFAFFNSFLFFNNID